MTLRLEELSWLWLLAAGLPIAGVAVYAFVTMSGVRRWSAIIGRVLVVGLLALALAGLTSVRRVDKAGLVVVMDVSGSTRAFVPAVPMEDGSSKPAVRAVAERLQQGLARGSDRLSPDDTVSVFAVDGVVRAAVGSSVVRSGMTPWRELTPSTVEGSDLAAAIRAAAGAVPPDRQGRIILVSDGLAGGGEGGQSGRDRALEAAGAVGRGTPIDVVPLSFADVREVVVEALDAPTRVASDSAPAPLTLTVMSVGTGPVRGRLSIMQEGQAVRLAEGDDVVVLQPGRNVLTVRVPLSPGRLHRFEAQFEPLEAGADRVISNNRSVAFTTSPGGGRVLLVDGTDSGLGTIRPLLEQLRAAGVQAEGVAAAGLDAAADLLSLQAHDLIVLVDVPADGLSAASQENLARYVSDTGGGLLMVGGPPPTANSFGAGGWKGTPIEPLLPVTLDLPDRLVMPSTAVVIVLDSSGSMAFKMMGGNATQQEVANRGASAAAAALDKQDLLGVIEFNSRSSWVVPLAPNTDPKKTAQEIMDISPGGGTNLPPALEMAYAALEPVKAAVKHVIVLSDGQSQGRRRLAAIAERFANAPGGPIRISSIAVGDEADTDGLERLARAGGGEYYRVLDPNILPRVFVKAVRVVRTPLIREEVFTPVLGPGARVSGATAGLTDLPTLGGVILTQPRLDSQKKNIEGVTYALLTPQGEPLLAHWRVGLGQVGAFTSSPLGAGWAKGWTGQGAGGGLWVQLVRSLSRSGAAGEGGRDLSVRVEGDLVRVRIDTPASETAAPAASLFGPSGSRIPLTVSLVSPGVFEGTAPVEGLEGGSGEGVYVATVIAGGEGGGAPLIGGAVKGSRAAAEYRLPPDGSSAAGTELLTRIAQETGGRVLSLNDLATMDAAGLFVRDSVEPRESRSPLWNWLVIAAAGVLLLDIATRRIAWDRRSGDGDSSRNPSPSNAKTDGVQAHKTVSDSPLAAAKRRARARIDG